MTETGLRIRVECQLREAFHRACKEEDLTAAQVIRAFMRHFVEQHEHGNQPDLFDLNFKTSRPAKKELT